jgi:cell division protein FtsB
MTRSILLGLFLFLLLAWYLSFLASRLDRLHHRVETSWEHLDALLQRRAAIALEISHDEAIDPATGMLLTAAAYQAREANIIERNEAESSLSETLRLLSNEWSSEVAPTLMEELKRVTEKISLAVTIHLEAVNSARSLRSKFIFRIFRLAGHAPLPVRYSFEDDIL